MTRGVIFDIQRFAINDGPGVRTTVFFKGCPLHCFWCHNPESMSRSKQLARYDAKCILCGGCAAVCPTGAIEIAATVGWSIDRSICRLSCLCADVCPAEALVIIGREVSPEEALVEVLADRPFYETSGGGATLSGGEPLAQPDFAEALVRACKAEGLHVALDTSGHVELDTALRVVDAGVDLVLYDVKSLDPERHKQGVGVDNVRILGNLRRLRAERADLPIVLRHPLIPGFNDRPDDFAALADLADELGLPIDVLPYHPLGQGKYESLGLEPPAEKLDTDAARRSADELVALLRGRGVEARIS